MKSSPWAIGYRNLFGEPTKSYEDMLSDLPSDWVITMAIILNNELNNHFNTYEENQSLIFNTILFRCSDGEKKIINDGLTYYRQNPNKMLSDDIFRREYFMKMVSKELNRNRIFKLQDNSAKQEFNFLLAYLLVIDEVKMMSLDLLKKSKDYVEDPLYIYIHTWTVNLNMYQFNEKASPLFEMFKVACLFKYSFSRWRPFLKEYLEIFGFVTIGQILDYFNFIFKTGETFKKGKFLSGMTFIKSTESNSNKILDSQIINGLIGKKEIGISHIKEYTLFENIERGYMVIDREFFFKKIYRGPFFELRAKTKLKNELMFNPYSSEVSIDVMEKICFKSIISSLQISKESNSDAMFFDDKSTGNPDCYYRKNKIIFLIEFKAYILGETFYEQAEPNTLKESFDKFKKYIDDRFIGEGSNPKGINQLKNQIKALSENSFDFDNEFKNNLHKKDIIVYPIICHNDFNFSLHGINEYLNEKFNALIDGHRKDTITIKNVTLINLNWLFDISLGRGNFATIKDFIDRYWKAIENRKKRFENGEIDDPIFPRRSFDEFYAVKYIHELPNSDIKMYENSMSKLLAKAGLTQQLFDEIV